jgi:hypothetical protein
MTTCTVSRTMSIDKILKDTPEGKIAMFRVVSMSTSCEDWLLGENVYIHRGKIWDFIADECHGTVNQFGLHFIAYIDR